MNTPRLGILISRTDNAGIIPLINLKDICTKISNGLYIIAVNVDEKYTETLLLSGFYKVDYHPSSRLFIKIFQYIILQFTLGYYLIFLSKNIDIWLFFKGDKLMVPMILAKLLRKKVIIIMGGLDLLPNQCLYVIPRCMKKINMKLCDNIILYSPILIKKWNLQEYFDKILIAHRHVLDFKNFNITNRLRERNDIIGYFGRLSGEKGALNFVQAISLISKRRNNLKFVIGGEGPLQNEIKRFLVNNSLNKNLDLIGWIPHEELPRYLNQLKLLVLPSYSEGLPNIMLEAMACGTPVLATPVGAVPDVIVDGKTGFIMEKNSPECIAENVVRALEHPGLEEIAGAGRRLVEENFTFERVVKRWKEVLDEI